MDNEDNEATLDDLVNALGGNQNTENGQENTEDSNVETTVEKDTESKEAEEPKTEPEAKVAPKAETKTQEQVEDPKVVKQREANRKASEVFAKMRVENTKYERTFKDLLGLLGVDTANAKVEDLNQLLQDKVLEAKAEKEKVPMELLKKLDILEQDRQSRELADVRTQALVGFQKVKDRFGLDDEGLKDFAVELRADGVDPFVTRNIDLESVYIKKHFEDLLKAAEQKGIQSEQARAAKAGNSSTPNLKKGKEDTAVDDQKVDTIAELSKWFSEQGAK